MYFIITNSNKGTQYVLTCLGPDSILPLCSVEVLCQDDFLLNHLERRFSLPCVDVIKPNITSLQELYVTQTFSWPGCNLFIFGTIYVTHNCSYNRKHFEKLGVFLIPATSEWPGTIFYLLYYNSCKCVGKTCITDCKIQLIFRLLAIVGSSHRTSELLSEILCSPANLRRNCDFSLQAITKIKSKTSL